MVEWRIYYGDFSVIKGTTEREWVEAPSEDVQVVVLMQPYPDGRRPWKEVSDRMIWTGVDEYDPWGWGMKYGKWMKWEDYDRLWKVAFYE